MWPGPNLRRKVFDLVDRFGAEVVLFGDAFPLAALGPEPGRRGASPTW